MKDQNHYTYQTRFTTDDPGIQILDAYGALFGQVERVLFAQIAAGKHPHQLKSLFLKRFGITARQYNGARIQLQGRIDSIKKRRPQLIQELQERIDSLIKKIKKLEKTKKKALLHQKRRRLNRLENKLSRLKKDHSENRCRLCFGSKKLFRAQYSLEENGFTSHEEWGKAWKQKRDSEFFIIGSKDETGGNQSCQSTIEEDGSLTLKLRLPNSLIEKHGKYLVIKGVRFSYGHQTILSSLQRNCAISYRFKKDHKGWQIGRAHV